ncbi:MAG TPA: DUF4294 domain-containing protein [Bacteroidia bacterium]|jgi:hypothetical protein|nr:DUF4294 domain-containing protein [Bacteroidia bacterium]
MLKPVAAIYILLFFMPLAMMAQVASIGPVPVPLDVKLPASVIDGDTVPIITIRPVIVVSERNFADINEAMKYYMLRRDVKVAYPYAVMAEATFKQCEETMQTMTSESDKKKYLKETEKIMMAQYKEELKSLTVNQGRILIKLINRQTGTTSYEMVKELRGSLSAFMWQTVARIFGNNLKDTYDPETEDKEIENIIGLIETGTI